ncbi:MAG: hypothetical protein NZ888_06320 [Candidatus Nitrosocaldus sp.]|nr:hypothetical protein [Candidatus Nitrosocaldus sp.]MCS7141782.1 hypothetical protein [Candidatus Nitrosocaldus sp.]MDW8000458.1 hypothetical protein [Candidatus Nitrosocaldus sp.]
MNEQCCAVCGEDIRSGICFECLIIDLDHLRNTIADLEERIAGLEKVVAILEGRQEIEEEKYGRL